jgi:hypothetical protein
MDKLSIQIRLKVSSVGGDIRNTTANTVIKTRGGVEINTQFRVVWIRRVANAEIFLNGFLLSRKINISHSYQNRDLNKGIHLVPGAPEVVREPPGGREIGGGTSKVDLHDALGIGDFLAGVKHCATDRCDVGASGWVLRVEDTSVRSKAAVCVTSVTREGSNTVVTGGKHDGNPLNSEFEEFETLPLNILHGEVNFGLTV